ncbi:MAG: DUF86 domain-containing protein [Candidatus Schekmanbacteria bacterium]|nr:DUF86 domain-containing protein [Candidatus Schekmanbacteria bacterium]
MSRFSQDIIRKLLLKLEEATLILNRLQAESEESLRKDLIKWYAVLHAFLIAIECTLDIGSHILSSVFNERFEEYREIIPLLGQHEVMPQELVKKLEGMAEFRNKLVHEYPEITLSKVYRYLQQHPKSFEEYARQIEKFLAGFKGQS